MDSIKDYKRTAIILFILFLLSLAFNIYLFTDHKEEIVVYNTKLDSLVTVRVDLEKELVFTNSELDKYKGLSEKLDSLVNEGNLKITEQENKIKDLIKREGNSSAVQKKLRAELAELKRLKDEYLERIDILITENEQLKTQNTELTATVTELNTQKGQLEKKVNTASALKAEYVKVTPMKKRINGNYAATSMAKKTNKIETCMSILDNQIAEAGEKTVYLVIQTPEGKTMGNRSQGSKSFKKANGEEVMYTASKTINYTKAKQDLCIDYEEEERIFPSGKYIIEVYVDGQLSATSSYILR